MNESDSQPEVTAADLVRLQQEKLREREVPFVPNKAPRSAPITDANLAEATNRLLAVAAAKSEERRAATQVEAAAKQEAEARRLIEKIAALRSTWKAPDRCVQFHELNIIDYNALHPWAKALKNTRSILGDGFTRAIIGSRGTGKTQLGVELMYDVTAIHKPALYCTTLWFLLELRATYRKDSKETEIDVLERYIRPSLLILDEFGKRGETDWENNMLFQLLDQRHQNLVDTLILSNETKAQFEIAAGPSLNRRIDETGGLLDTSTWPKLNPKTQ